MQFPRAIQMTENVQNAIDRTGLDRVDFLERPESDRAGHQDRIGQIVECEIGGVFCAAGYFRGRINPQCGLAHIGFWLRRRRHVG